MIGGFGSDGSWFLGRLVPVLSVVALFCGSSLLLGSLAPLRRPGIRARLRPYSPGATGAGAASPASASFVASARSVLVPLAEDFGSRLGSAVGIHSDLQSRLDRAGFARTASEFRLVEFARAFVAGLLTLGALVFFEPAPLIWLLALGGVPVITALATEQHLESSISVRTERLEAELPVVTEQIAVLLAAGMSLGAVLDRIARRGDGAAASDLRRVQLSVRQGSSEIEALRMWAERARCRGVDRLVDVLCLHREATDLGTLLTTEAKAIRADAHRRLIESIERRSQLVWVPVTVATLVPGLILIGVPFIDAMSQITR